jgi:hypothetical protein
MGDIEAFGFATQLKKWLHDNGYETSSIVHCVYKNPAMGQRLVKKSDLEFDLVIGTKK